MRLLFVLDSLGTGGTETSMAVLAPHLVAAGADLRVVCLLRREGNLEEAVRRAGAGVSYLPPAGWLRRTLALRRALRTHRPHVVHSALFQSDVTARLAAVGLPVRVLNSLVSTPYDPVRRRDPRVRPWRLALLRWVDAATAHLRTDHFHAVSRAARDSAVQALRLSPRHFTVVPRGRPAAAFAAPDAPGRERLRHALGLGRDDEALLHVGRQDFSKGQDTLLHATALLAAQRPAVRLFVLGGRGPASDELAALQRRLGLDDRVSFLGRRDDVADWLAACDLFVFPSRYEGLPGALLEAMACGLPAVASDVPAIREVASGGGVRLVPPDDPQALAAVAGELLADPGAAAELGRQGREAFSRSYHMDLYVDGMIEIYQRLLATPRRRGSEDPR